MTTPQQTTTPAAERMRRSRQRRASGLRCFTVELRESEIDRLVRRGLLKPDQRRDHEAVLAALYRFLDATL